MQKEVLISFIWKSITAISKTMPNVKENQAFTLSRMAVIKPNGPAVGFSKRNPTTAPGRVPLPRASGARKLSRCKEGLAHVFAVMVQILLSAGTIAVQV
jgi:hypothetical protein